LYQLIVLRGFKFIAFQAFQLNANGIVVAVAAAPVARDARMPSTLLATDKLPNFASALDEEVRRDFQAANRLKIGMSFPIELIGKELLNCAIAKLAGWQADGVNHNQIDLGGLWALTKVGRLAFFGAPIPALLPHTQVHEGTGLELT
jgi:hypothetical protein